MLFLCVSSDTTQCNEYSWRASHQQHTVWKCVFLESLSLKGSRWHVRQGLFWYRNLVPPNSNSSKMDLTEASFQFSYSCDHLCWSTSQVVLHALCILGSISIWPEAKLFCCMTVSGTLQHEAVAIPSSFPPLLTIPQKYILKILLNFSESENPYTGPRLCVL